MKQLRIIGLALLALLALGAFAASSASAVELEGILPATTTGTATGGAATLENTNKEKISCKATSTLEIKFTDDEKGTATIHFTGCLAEGIAPANSLGDESGVILSKVLLLVCLVEPKTLVFGILIEPIDKEGHAATEHIEIPAVGALALVKGAVIARSESANAGKEFKYSLKGKLGVQTEATECTILGKTFKHSFASALDSATKDFAASEEAKFTTKLGVETLFMDEK
jgi:hypothetical protein